jgi:transketolase
MIEINKLNARVCSKLGQAGAAFGIALMELQKNKPEICVLSADMSKPVGLDRFKSKYPEMFFNVGIAEQNLVGIAAGMASEGKKVIVTAQAVFISMRSCEQVRQYMGYMRSNIIAVGISSGFALTFFGNTHYAIEDISIMRSVPGLIILSPSDAGQSAKILCAAVEFNGPVYIRLTGVMNCPIVYHEDYEYEIGKGIQLREGSDITVFASGSMVYNSLKAADILEEKNISLNVIDMHTIKPLDKEIIKKHLDSKLFVSLEEHNIIGGLGTAISECLSTINDSPYLLTLGVMDKFSEPGDYPYLIEQNRLMPNEIAEDILETFNSIKKYS